MQRTLATWLWAHRGVPLKLAGATNTQQAHGSAANLPVRGLSCGLSYSFLRETALICPVVLMVIVVFCSSITE